MIIYNSDHFNSTAVLMTSFLRTLLNIVDEAFKENSYRLLVVSYFRINLYLRKLDTYQKRSENDKNAYFMMKNDKEIPKTFMET